MSVVSSTRGMTEDKVNPDRVYYNYEGRFPPAGLRPDKPAAIPPESARSHPKRITDTTLRDGTQANPKDIRMLIDLSQGRIRETGMLASASDHHIFDKLQFRSKEAAVEKYLETIMTAAENGFRFEETGAELEFHGHNDFGLATANSIAAWVYGCNRVNTSFAGLGADSLDLVNLTVAIEEEFSRDGRTLKFPEAAAEEIQSVQQILDFLAKEGFGDAP